MDNDKAIDILNDLIQTCKDGQEGYKEAADRVRSPDLKTFFTEQSKERSRCMSDLQDQVRALGGDPDRKGSAAGAIHRAWMNVKGTMTGKDDAAILNEVERGEDSAVAAFEDALAEPISANIRPIVERWYRQIKLVHDRVKQMRDSRSATAGRKT